MVRFPDVPTMVSTTETVSTARSFAVLKVLLFIVFACAPTVGSESSRSDCASKAIAASRRNLSREIESAVTDVSSSMRLSSRIILNMTLARTEDYLDRIRNLVLDRLTLIERCFRTLRYTLLVYANPMCLTREGLKLQSEINAETLRWARLVSRLGQDEYLIFKEERSQRIIDAVSKASNKAAVPLARSLVQCFYGKRIANMLRI